MKFIFSKLSQKHAVQIADEWKYENEYAFYDMSADIDDYEEFIDEAQRNLHDYYEALVDDELAGFFCVIQEDGMIEIGLGLRPDCCGKGIGKMFVSQICDFIENHYEYQRLVMNVALFNRRAIRVYEACGFRTDCVFKQKTNGSVYDFMRLVKE